MVDAPPTLPKLGATDGARIWQRIVLIGLILAVGLTLRIYRVNYPPADYHCWRQTQTLMIAHSYAERDMNLLHPRVYWRNTVDEPLETEGIVGGTELQVTPWLTALLYKVLGTAPWVDRVVPIFFSLAGVVFFFLLLERFAGLAAAGIGAFLLSVSPMYLFFGRVHMPEAFALAVSFMTLYWFDRWLETRGWRDFALALAACVLTLLGKPTMALIALPMLYLVLLRHGWRFVLEWRFYLFGGVTLLFFVAFNLYTFRVLPDVSQLLFYAPGLTNRAVLFTAAFYQDMARSIWTMAVGWPLLLLALPGLLLPTSLRASFPHAWALGVLAYFALAAGGNQINDYYQIVLAPPAAFLAGAGLARWAWRGPAKVVVAAVVLWAGYTSVTLALPMYQHAPGQNYFAAGEWIRENTPEDALVLSASPNPATLYFADRTGWTCWMEAKGSIEFNAETIARARQLGASVVVVPDGDKLDDAYYPLYRHIRDSLYESYRCYRGDNFAVFLLDQPADLAPPEDGRIVFGTLAARKHLRGLWGRDYFADAQQATYTDLRYNKTGGIRVDLPEGVTSILLKLSSPVADNRLTIRFDGKEIATGYFPKAWAQADIILPFETPPAPGRHSIDFEVTQQRDGLVGLLVWMLQVQR
ncbi:MAG: hypothetical protein RLZZ303_1020 [Candidatus Hydrogenedentota bacterium]|jgi:hypothetical protein